MKYRRTIEITDYIDLVFDGLTVPISQILRLSIAFSIFSIGYRILMW